MRRKWLGMGVSRADHARALSVARARRRVARRASRAERRFAGDRAALTGLLAGVTTQQLQDGRERALQEEKRRGRQRMVEAFVYDQFGGHPGPGPGHWGPFVPWMAVKGQ